MKAQINITEENEKALSKIQILFSINDFKLMNKDELINKSIELVHNLITSLDEESLFKITGLKKTW